jgi:predicted anti-sigma-YlaC factor YlaD
MNCEELISYLSDYIDQNLDEELRLDAQEHLATCQNCRIVLDSTQKTILMYRQAGLQRIPGGRRSALFARLLAVFEQRKGDEPSKS